MVASLDQGLDGSSASAPQLEGLEAGGHEPGSYLDAAFDPESEFVDGDGNPIETPELDADGNPIEDNPDPDAPIVPGDEGAAPAGDDPPADEYAYVPEIPENAFTDAELEQLAEAQDSPDVNIRMRADIFRTNRLIQFNMQAQQMAQSQLGAYSETFQRKHAGAMNEYINSVEPSQRGSEKTRKEAALWAVNRYMEKTGVSVEVALEHALNDLRGAGPAAAPVVRKNVETPPLDASQSMAQPRAAQGSGGASGVRMRQSEYDLRKLDGLPGFSNKALVDAARADLTKGRR